MKRFIFKAHDATGGFLATIPDVVDDPKFTSYINSGLGEMTFKLPRSVFSFDEGNVIAQNNEVTIDCHDTDGSARIYSGYISKYAPVLNKGQEYINVTCLGYSSQLVRYIHESAGATTIAYNSYDPTNILKDVLDKFATAGGKVDYDGSSTDDTSTTVSYSMNTYTVKEALEKVNELAPNGWYYFVGADNIVQFHAKKATADHTFVLGKDVMTIIPEKSLEGMTNKIYFTGGEVTGTPLYKKYTRSSSITNYGLYAKKMVDSRVTDETTMDIMAGAVLDRGDTPETRTTLVIRDNNAGDGRGYDIESISPGQTVKLLGYTQQNTNLWDSAVWDVDKWDYDLTQVSSTVQQIMKVTYEPTKVTLELSSKLPDISHRVEDIRRNQINLSTNENPTTPTT